MKFKFALIVLIALFLANFGYGQNTLNNIGLTSSTPASVAFSLRQLSTSYTGPLVRIYVGTSFYDVYPDASTKNFSLSSKISAAIGSYNAAVSAPTANALSSIITAGSTNATVAIWYDQSGNSIHVLSASPNAKIITSGSINTVNGQPTINFIGTNSFLTSSASVNYSAQTLATVNTVAQNVASTNYISGIISVGDNGGWGLCYDPSTTIKGYWVDASGGNGAFSNELTNDTKIITGFIGTTTNSYIYINSVQKGTKVAQPISNGTNDKIYVGTRGNFGGRQFIGNISEVFMFPKNLSSTEQSTLESSQSIFIPPTVTITSSASGSICAGTSVTFTATTTGFTNPYYQWYSNGSMISGATSSTYTTTSLNNNDAIKVSVNEGPVGSITTSGLILNLDATNPSSYAGTGTSWNNLVTGNAVSNFTLSSSYASFSTDNGGVIRFGSNGSGEGTTGGSASSSTGFSNLSAYTVEVWVKAAGTRGDYNPTIAGNTNYVPSFFSEKVSGGTVNMVLSYNARGWGGIDNNSYRYAANMGGWQTPAHPTTNYSSDLNNWVQILATYNGSTLTLYRNGVSIGSSTTNYNLRQTSTGYWIAHRWDMTDGVYGDYSKVMMYNRALSTAEVSANYSAFNDRFLGSGVSSSTITTTVTPGPTAPSITVVGDGCINKTTLTTTSGLSSYTWYKDNVAIAGATTTTYSPTAAGDYKVVVSNGTCSTTSAVTAIYTCGVSADGKMVSIANPGSLLSMEGGANFGTGIDNVGKILNTTGLTTTTGTIGATTAVINGIISATNAVTSSIGVVYSTDVNFGTSSTSPIQSNVAAGTYATTITGLTASTTYYAKSFITNKAGTSYGPVVNFTTSTPPVTVGDVYGGGIVFYVLQSGDAGYDANVQHGLIAATANQSNGVNWAKTASVTGATGTAIGTGLANTNLIISNQGNSGSYAAKIARDYAGGGYTDWYLPSAEELHKMVGVTALNLSTYYHSSTEYNSTNAIYEGLTNGDFYRTPNTGSYPSGTTKTGNPLNVRAIRSF